MRHLLVSLLACLLAASAWAQNPGVTYNKATRAVVRPADGALNWTQNVAGHPATSLVTDSEAAALANAAIAHADAADSPIHAAITALQVKDTGQDEAIAAKVDKVEGKQLSSEDFTAAEKSKLAALVANYKGLHVSGSALAAAVAEPAAGDWAIVSGTDTVWIWDADTLAWLDSGSVSVPATWPGITGDVAESAALVAYLSNNYVPGTALAEWVDSLRAEISAVAPEGYAAVLAHVTDTANPHDVTAAKVGLGNCDNTSDANKPVSTATQAALDGKLDSGTLPDSSAKTDDDDGEVIALHVVSGLNDSVAALLHFDAADSSTVFADSSNHGIAITQAGNACMDTYAPVFGTACGYFPDTSSYINMTIPSIGTNDFRLCFRYRSFAMASPRCLLEWGRYQDANGILLFGVAGGGYNVNFGSGRSSYAIPASQANGEWHEVELTRHTGVFRFFVDGAILHTWTESISLTGTNLRLGSAYYRSGEDSAYGWFDEFIFDAVAGNITDYTPEGVPFGTATKSNVYAPAPLRKSLNLSDLTDSAAARNHLGLGTAAITAASAYATAAQGAKADSALQASALTPYETITANDAKLALKTNSADAIPASKITQDSTHKMVSEAQIDTWSSVPIAVVSGFTPVVVETVDNVATVSMPAATDSAPGHLSAADHAAFAAKASVASLASHVSDTSNPHVVTKAQVGLGDADNTSDAAKPISTAQKAALDGKVPTTRTVAGHALSADVTVSRSDVGLGNCDNTSDAAKPISTATAAALALKAPLESPTFTGTVSGISKAMVGLGNVEDKNSTMIRSELTGSNVTSALGYTPGTSSLVLGASSTTAYRGDYGALAYAHSQVVGNAHNIPEATTSTPGLMTAAQVNKLNGLGGVSVITTKTTNDTAASVDSGTLLRFAPTATPLIYTIPLNATVLIPVAAQIDVALVNDTDLVIQAAPGVTLNGVNAGERRLSDAYTGATLRKVSADVWEAYGDGVDE